MPSPSDSGSATATLDVPRDVNDEINDVLRPIVPWFTSLLFHLGIIALALILIVVPAMLPDPEYPTPQVNSSLMPITDLTRTSEAELTETSSSMRSEVETEFARSESEFEKLETSEESLSKLIGVLGGQAGGRLGGVLTDAGNSNSITGTIFETGSGANKIIFIVDASGSLVDTLPFVIAELKRSIAQLREPQEFTVLFFQDGEPREAVSRGWKRATAENKRRVAEYITLQRGNIVPQGVTDPVATLKQAMSYRPELVFLLSDNITGRGKYEVNRGVLLDMLEKLNARVGARISTIQFIHPDPLNTLKEIAERHNGDYKYVTAADLGLR